MRYGNLSGMCKTILATLLLSRCQIFPVKYTHCSALHKHICKLNDK